MKTMTCEAAQERIVCEECGDAEAKWAVCFEIAKKYEINDDGDP